MESPGVSPQTRNHSDGEGASTEEDQSESARFKGHSPSGSQPANMVELFRSVLYCLTPVLIAPKVTDRYEAPLTVLSLALPDPFPA